MKKIIVAPLNWGLGHAARCIPIIDNLLEQGLTPVLASDGAALELLVKEYPDLERVTLPSYQIRYGKRLKLSLFRQVPRIRQAVKIENRLINQYIKENREVAGIISDNRLGVRSKLVTSVYLSHQLRVLSGATTFLTSWVHRRYINKFDECWVPDTPFSRFSGRLSQVKSLGIPIRHLGILSRFSYQKRAKKFDILVLLSGPEPNRSKMETQLIEQLKSYKGQVGLVRGTTKPFYTSNQQLGIKIFDMLASKDLEHEINQSDIIISRSGYSSIMDMAVLGKRAFFIPTKGQYEQEYLARYLSEHKQANYATEDTFSLSKLDKMQQDLKFEVTEMNLELPASDFFERK